MEERPKPRLRQFSPSMLMDRCFFLGGIIKYFSDVLYISEYIYWREGQKACNSEELILGLST